MNIYKYILFSTFKLIYFLVFCKYMSLYIKQKPPVINEKKFTTESVVMVFFMHSHSK